MSGDDRSAFDRSSQRSIESELRALTLAQSLNEASDPGLVQARATLTSLRIEELFCSLAPPPGLCLLATGGLGRGELAPDSDIDILAWSAQGPSELIAELVRQLWEWQLPITVISHDRGSLFAALQRDLAGATAILEGRFLAGDRAAFAGLRDDLRNNFLSPKAQFFARCKIQEFEQRRAQSGALEDPEPDLKIGVGGQRDTQLAFLLRALLEPQLWSSDESSVLPGLARQSRQRLIELDPYLAEVSRHQPLVDRTRVELAHLGSHQKLLRGRQRLVAEALGYFDRNEPARSISRPGEPLAPSRGVDRFLTELLFARRSIARACDSLVRELRPKLGMAARLHRAVLDSGVLAVGDDALELSSLTQPGPSEVLGIFAFAQRSKRKLGPSSLERLRNELSPNWGSQDFANPEVQRRFRELLCRPLDVAACLRWMHRARVLPLVLPEFHPLDGLAQFDELRPIPIDEQALRALEVLEDPGLSGREARARFELTIETPRRDLLRLATMLRDLARASEVDERKRDEELLPALASRLGLSDSDLWHLRGLLRERHSFARLAERRKVRDEGTVEALLEACGHDRMRLDHLYLMTCAHHLAVAAEHFTSYHAAILARLYDTARGRLDDPSANQRSDDPRRRFFEALPQDRHAALQQHLELAPPGYIEETDPFELATELELIEALDDRPQVQLAIGDGACRITTIARDWQRRITGQTGALSALSLSIIDATFWRRSDGLTIDRFVAVDNMARSPEALAQRLRELFSEVSSGKLDLNQRVREASAKVPRPDFASSPEPTRISSSNDQSSIATVVEISTQDRMGLLYDLARSFEDLELELHFAKISTRASRAIDTFYLSHNSKKLDDETRRRLISILRSRLEEGFENDGPSI